MLHTTTLPLSLHLGLRGLLRPSGKKFREPLGIPSGETPASTEGIIDPNKRNVINNFFMSLSIKYKDGEILVCLHRNYYPSFNYITHSS